MARQSHKMTTGTAAAQRHVSQRLPRDVQRSFLLWLTALGAGVVETIFAILTNDMALPQAAGVLAIRLIITVALFALLVQMRGGRNWARIALALLLGGVGTVSLLYDPIEWLIRGNSLVALLRSVDAAFVLFALVRAVHIVAVLSALVLMFRPNANAYFRDV